MNYFYGYPIPDDRHPKHVNWVRTSMSLCGSHNDIWGRVDGKRVCGRFADPAFWERELEDMERIDREDPMPRPPVLVGQVWRLRNGWICRAEPFSGEPRLTLMNVDGNIAHTWDEPPYGSDLVWGPYAPWQDTRESEP